MEIIIKGSEKEIANLILTMQGQQSQKSVTITNRAEKAGFTMRAVQYWEHGTKNITLENAAKLLDALGMEITIQDKPA